jgi:diguanylate cyclase (GGDEF)-like protein/PAS domain S-box-containing protein
MALLAFLIARALLRYKERAVIATTNFLSAIFVFEACILLLGVGWTLSAGSMQLPQDVSSNETIASLVTLLSTTLWTFGFVLLVSQRMTAEIREAKDNLELVFNTNPDAVMLSRLTDGMIVRVNDTFVVLTGYTRQEVLGKTVFEVNLWENMDDRQKLLTQIKETGICEGLEAVFRRKNGSLLIGSVTARIIVLQDVPHLVSVTHDITSRKQSEENLRESEEKFRVLLDSQESNIMVIDYDGVHQYVNTGGVASFAGSASAQDILGKRLHDLYPARIADWQLEKIRAVFRTGQGMSGDFSSVTPRGTNWWHLNLQPIRNAAGQVTQVMVNSLDITERKHAELALRESEERFHSLADTAPVLIWMAGTDGLCNFFNQPWLDFTGRTLEQEVGEGWTQGIFPEDYQYSFDLYQEAFKARQPFNMEYRLRRADGVYRWIVDQGVPRFLPDGSFIGYIGSCLDISDRKCMEEELRDSERRTATILRLSPIVIGVSTVAEGRYTDVNDAYEQVLGYTRDEVIGHTSIELNIWTESDMRERILSGMKEHGRVENLEIRLRRKSGEIFPTLIFITPLMLHDTPCLLTMMMDITDRKRVEEQLRETRDALQTIIYSSPLAMLTLDADDRVTMWNPAAEDLFGWSEKQIIGQLNPTVPERKSKEYDALRLATLKGMAFSNVDTLRRNRDGVQIPVSLSVAPLRGQQGQVVGRMHIIADITERKQFQEDLRKQATTDELTKVSNRRYFIELANSEIKRAIRLKRPPAIVLIDIDHFKQVNDTYGHAAGDQALIAFSKICLKQIREIDVFARFGGDEFVLLLPETTQEQAYEVVERVRKALVAQPIAFNGQAVSLTISSGISSLVGQESFDTILSQADRALYRAKEAGRNRVIRFDTLSG